MKVIFLDFDGVLNSAQEAVYHNRFRKEKSKALDLLGDLYYKILRKFVEDRNRAYYYYFKLFSTHIDFCPISCSNVQYILEEVPDAKIVISSVWRSWGVKYCSLILKHNGIDGNRIIDITTREEIPCDCTPKPDYCERGHQIDHWMKDKELSSYVILDDDSDMMPKQMKNFVKTDNYHGLNFRQAMRAIEILKAEK